MQTTTTSEHYKPAVRFGLGGAPLGNEFAVITEPLARQFPSTVALGEQFEIARKGAFSAPTRMREEGIIKAGASA